MNAKSALSMIGTCVLGVCTFEAEMPSQLSNQVPQVFPESQRGWIGLVLAVMTYAAHRYSASQHIASAIAAAQLPAALPVPPAAQPPKP